VKDFPSTNIPWSAVAKELGTRSRLHCLNKFNSIRSRPARGATKEGGPADDDLLLLETIHREDADDETEIIWSRLAPKNAWSRWRALRKSLPGSPSFREALATLLQAAREKAPNTMEGASQAVEAEAAAGGGAEMAAMAPAAPIGEGDNIVSV
jgi:hypothetical protein